MNKQEKELLNEQSKIIGNSSTGEIHDLLIGPPPLEPGEFLPIVLQNTTGIINCLLDRDQLVYKLKSRIARSSKFDTKVIKKYELENKLTFDQAKALLAMRNQYLCDLFAQMGVDIFIEKFTARLEENFDKFISEIIRETLNSWRADKSLPALPASIPIEKLPSLIKMREEFIQSQSGGRPVGKKGKSKQLSAKQQKEKTEFFRALIFRASVQALNVNKEKDLTYEKIGEQIVELEVPKTAAEGSTAFGSKRYALKSSEPGQSVRKAFISKQKIHQWFKEFGLDIKKIDNDAREYINKTPGK